MNIIILMSLALTMLCDTLALFFLNKSIRSIIKVIDVLNKFNTNQIAMNESFDRSIASLENKS